MAWTTLKTTNTYLEAELMQQMLAAHQIPARVVAQGVQAHFGCGTPAVVQVYPQDWWTALLLLSPVDEADEGRLE
ncbi:MAG: hypothetical protein Fur0046_23430 [Cyanobacteria bacterium J069]|nr:MAG: hypothetical protein D6742_07860 [Cyanobacteria bacterium J069]